MHSRTEQGHVRRFATKPRGFTLVELIVVIAIVVLLVGILLPALAGASAAAKRTRTEGTMNEFSKACDQFQMEHGFYPGVFDEIEFANFSGPPPISGTENALLHLMGGYVESTDPLYDSTVGYDITLGSKTIRVIDDQNRGHATAMGNGPRINGRQYGTYYTPAGDELGIAKGQLGADSFQIPDLLDAWGNPIVYLRKARRIGPIFEDDSGNPPQFYAESSDPYLQSTGIGESQNNQTDDGTNLAYSVFNAGGSSTINTDFDLDNWNLMQLVGHQGFTVGTPGGTPPLNYTATRGDYILLSAGEDGTYFSRLDGAGSESQPADEIPGAAVIGEYDDVVLVGGGAQ